LRIALRRKSIEIDERFEIGDGGGMNEGHVYEGELRNELLCYGTRSAVRR